MRSLTLAVVLAVFFPASAHAEEPGTTRNAYLSNRTIGLAVHMESLGRFSLGPAPMLGLALPVSSSTEIHLLGGYHATVPEAWGSYRSWDTREIDFHAGACTYFNPDALTSPYVGSAVTGQFFLRYDEIWGRADRFLTTGNCRLSAQFNAGLAVTPASFLQIRAGYVLTFFHDVFHDTVRDGVMQSLQFGVIVKLRGK